MTRKIVKKALLILGIGLLGVHNTYASTLKTDTDIRKPRVNEMNDTYSIPNEYYDEDEIRFVGADGYFPSVEAYNNRIATGIMADKLEKDNNGCYEYPASATVEVVVNKNEKSSHGTGVLISKNVVLTSAHLFTEVSTVKSGKNEGYTYIDIAKYKNVEVYANGSKNKQGEKVDTRSTIISPDYYDSVNKIKKSLMDGESTWRSVYESDKELYKNDWAILILNKDIGNTYGWVGVMPLEVTGGQKWGTLYQYPIVIPNLPSLEKLETVLKAEAEPNNEHRYFKKGVVIDYKEAMEQCKDKAVNSNHQKHIYDELFEMNDSSLYKSYSPIYCNEGLLEYNLASESGASGGPIIVSKYNFSTCKYDSYVVGVHAGYLVQDDINEKINIYGDLQMCIKRLGMKLDFNNDYPEDDKRNWETCIDIYGKSVASPITESLVKYLKKNELSNCEQYMPNR